MSEAISTAFQLLYGRAPDDAETARLIAFGVLQGETERDIMRRILAATDRQHLGSPFTIRFGPEDIVYTKIEGFELALDKVDVAVAGDIFARGAYEVHLTQFMRDHVKTGMRIVDVGANIGYFSMLCSGLVGDYGEVIAFEPNTENARLLSISTLRNNAKNIKLLPMALSPTRGNAVFTAYQGSNGGFVAGSLEDQILQPNCQIVPTMPLDEMVQGRVDLIKIDVEGAEGLVIAGAKRTIEECRPIVTSEFSPEMLGRISGLHAVDYLNMFKSKNYKIEILGRGGAASIIEDVDAFMSDYGAETRIEDLAFLPAERF